MSEYRRCETCGNDRCCDNMKAVFFAECHDNEFCNWKPKYVWIGMDKETPEKVDEQCIFMDRLMEAIKNEKSL